MRRENTERPVERPAVLFYTACGGSYGMGHLRRCLSIIRAGRGVFDAVVFLARVEGSGRQALGGPPQGSPGGGGARVSAGAPGPVSPIGRLPGVRFIDDLGEAPEADLVVSDVRETGRGEMKRLRRVAPVLSIDDLEAGSSFSHVSIRTLAAGRVPPHIDGPVNVKFPSGERNTDTGPEANFGGFPFVVLGDDVRGQRRIPFGRKEGILISFGGSDPENLSSSVASLLLSAGLRPTVVKGPFFAHDPGELACELVETPADLPRLVNRSGVLITSYGITVFEAFTLGTPVILVNRSEYHASLACALPLVNLGAWGSKPPREFRGPLLGSLADVRALEGNARAALRLVDGRGAERVARVIEDALGGLRRDCLFGHGNARSLARCEDRTILRCRRCGDLFMFETRPRAPGYDSEEYFRSEYRKLYGRTYVEDRDNITRLGEMRIRKIERLLGRKGKLLDVGCAMGFFLDAARKKGWSVSGIEISRFAGDWGRRKLSLDIRTGSFLEVELEPGAYDAVTFFYVAEHFAEIEKVVEKARRILKKGGMLALAMPNRSGMSFRSDRRGYLERRPVDHFFDTSPKNLSRFLRMFDIIKARVVVTGIHPERFLKNTDRLGRFSRLVSRIYTLAAKLFRLGDTFEYYGIKK